tara:strand:- start:8542 stop:9534 length:993 start_codon:yes stop_codon:yes gene_type:complete
MKSIFLNIILLSLLLPESQVGTTSANFLGIGVGSRAIAMGGAFCSVHDGPSVIYWNPGAISRFENDKLLVSNASWLVDSQIYFSTYIKKINDKSLGLYWTYLDYGREEITTLDDQDGTGLYWDASDLVLGIMYSMNLTDRFSFGGGVKYIGQNIYNESSSSLAIDMGLLYTSLNDNFNIGMSISNIGFDMRLSGKDLYETIDLDPENYGNNETIISSLYTDSFPLPIFYRMGFSTNSSISDNLNLLSSLDMVIPSDDVEHLNLGFELSYLDRVFIRCGYKELGNQSSEQGITFGFGSKVYLFGLDLNVNYAYQDFGLFGYSPHFDFEFNF